MSVLLSLEVANMRQLRNYMEEAVEQYIEQWLPQADVCQCEDCRLDIMAIMLNALPPQYGVTDTGAMFAKLREFSFQHRADIMAAMISAIEKVKGKPSH